MEEWRVNLSGKAPCEVGIMVMVEFGDGSKSEGYVEDFYWGIDGDSSDICRWKFMRDQTETPEEKEALDMIDTTSKQVESLANDSELPTWENGTACVHDSIYGFAVIIPEGLFFKPKGMNKLFSVSPDQLSKSESPEQKAERERDEAIKIIQRDMEFSGSDYYAAKRLYEKGYRKEKQCQS